MILFQIFFKIIKKNLLSISIYFFIFSVLMLFFTGSNEESTIQSFSETKLSISIINEDTGTLGKTVTSYLGSFHNLVELPNDKDVLQDSLFYRNVDYILFIPSNFSEKMKKKDYSSILKNVKLPDGIAGRLADTQLNQFLNTLSLYLENGYDESTASSYALSDMKKSSTLTLKSSDTKNIGEPNGMYYFFGILPYIYICLMVVGIGPILSTFQKKEINKRIQCSSLSFQSRNLQLALGSIVFALVCYFLFFILATIMYSKTLFTLNGAFCLINSSLALLFGISIAFLSSMFAKNINVFSMISNTVGLSLSFLGGVLVPLSIMDKSILNISKFLPTYWYSKTNDILSSNIKLDSHISELIKSFTIQLGFSLAIFAIALFLLRIKKENA